MLFTYEKPSEKVITPPSGSPLVLRAISSEQDFDSFISLQRLVWGSQNVTEITPSYGKIIQGTGGIVVGAFDSDNRLIGFVVSLPAIDDGKPVHWSYRMAVLPEFRDLKLGEQLKLYQKDICLSRGIRYIYWTYNPFESRNAYLNLIKLGGKMGTYLEGLFASSGSPIHGGDLGDRFLIQWDLHEMSSYRLFTKEEIELLPNLSRIKTDKIPADFIIEIPENLSEFKQHNPDKLLELSHINRHALRLALSTHDLSGFCRSKVNSYYVFKEKSN